eukprot:TRINITY_DN1357_c0_g1_i1.p1 TRINITY_DN1357_c0_g1~~TRINITY_DN1357_c0_g1_i1.p1  ORF type:complete len:562 (-),score=97.22 TRINITY_DN1357_c0_g1_i1:117-1802(-)
MAARMGRSLSRSWHNAANHNGTSYRTIISAILFLAFLVTGGLLFRSSSQAGTSVENGSTDSTGSTHSHARNFLPFRSKADPYRIKAEQLFKQAKEHLVLVKSYAGIARQGKQNMTKVVSTFSEQADSYLELLSRAENKALLDDSTELSQDHYRRFETDMNELFKLTKKGIQDWKHIFDDELNMQRLEDQLFQTNYQLAKVKKQGSVASLIAAKSVPKSLHCLTMRLMAEYVSDPEKYRPDDSLVPMLEDPKLFHYVILSDSVIGAAVAVYSTVKNTKNTKKHVFHIVTDKMNVAAMQVWFKKRPPLKAHVEVKSVEDFKFLTPSYVPLLRQLESPDYLRSYHKAMDDMPSDTSKFNVGNPKHILLSYLKFYLPEMFPKLHKILLLDDDVVVQKDLTPLWEVNLGGKVNGAVETCFGSFHRLDKYINFANPLIRDRFDPKACGWAFGLNIFDLDAWRNHKCTEEYHHWQTLNEGHALWKLGTLPPGLLTFYKTTVPLDKSWHLLGLGYNPNIDPEKIKSAAVIHYNGNMKPWLDIALSQYKEYWTKYVGYGLDVVSLCNFEK